MKVPIHTTITQEARQYLQNIQDVNKCNLNVAIEMVIAHNMENEQKLKTGILDAVIDEVLVRYMGERVKQQ